MRASILFVLLLTAATGAAEKPVVITNATVYDGGGGPAVKAAVEIHDGKITAIGKVEVGPDARVIDGTGLIVCPGFIDLHTHSDSAVVSKSLRPNTCYAVQGVTTIVTGNCGSGPVDVAKFFRDIEAGGVGVERHPSGAAQRRPLAGHGQRQPQAVGRRVGEDGSPRREGDGRRRVGLATGLIYNPGTYAKTEEIVALAKISAKHGGHYASHIRNEGGNLLDAIQEAITVGKESGCPVHISHIKASGRAAHGLSVRAVALIEGARKGGQKVTADQYPYTASSTSLRATIVPTRYREGSTKDYVARYADPQTGPRLKADLAEAISERDHGKAIQIASYGKKPAWQGKRLSEIAEMEKKDVLDIVIEIETNGGASIVNFGMNEEDVRVYMKQPWVATASDGSAKLAGRQQFPAPPQLRHLPAEGRLLRDRGKNDSARSGDPLLFRAAGRHPRLQGPRVHQGRPVRGRGGVRPEDVPRHGHLREAAPTRPRREVPVRERHADHRRWEAQAGGVARQGTAKDREYQMKRITKTRKNEITK